MIESWFSTVKSEEGERFESYAHAKQTLFDYIEVFYNQRPCRLGILESRATEPHAISRRKLIAPVSPSAYLSARARIIALCKR